MSNQLAIQQEDIMINILQSQKEMKHSISHLEIAGQDFERRITELENNVPINSTLNNYLTGIRRAKIVELLGGKLSKAYKHEYPKGSQYKKLANKCFAEAMRSFNIKFNLRNYGELKQHQYEEAVRFWNDFTLPTDLLQEIDLINNQMELFAM